MVVTGEGELYLSIFCINGIKKLLEEEKEIGFIFSSKRPG
jgi:hypothetical protein